MGIYGLPTQNLVEPIKPCLTIGQEDVSYIVTAWRWERETRYGSLDEAWKNSARTDPADPASPLKSMTRVLHIACEDGGSDNDLPDGWDADGNRASFVCTASFPYGDDNAEIRNVIHLT